MNDKHLAARHMPATRQLPSQNAALLIDFDNVTMGIRSNLAAELRKLLDSDIIRGKVSVQRAYADWRRYPQYVVPLSEASIDLIFAPAYGSTKKNATDIRLAIDALEIVFTRPEIGTFILLSGDSDFSSMVLKLKEYGKYVIGVGLQESASDLLVQNCDEYYSYSSLSGLTSFADMQRESVGPWELCARAVEKMVERGDVMRSDRLKQVMVELDPTFDEKSIGFTKFNKYLAEAASRGLISLRKLENGQFEVGPSSRKPSAGGEARVDYAEISETPALDEGRPGSGRRTRGRARGGRGRREPAAPPGGEAEAEAAAGEPEAAAEPVLEKRGSDGRGGAGLGLREAYNLLREVVGSMSRGEPGVRDSEVKREMLRKHPEFDEAALGFSKFSRFLKQAHDEEIVNVEQDSDGNLQIAPLQAGGARDTTPDRGRRGKQDRQERRGGLAGRRGRRGGGAAARAPSERKPEAAESRSAAGAEAAEAEAVEAEAAEAEASMGPEQAALELEARPEEGRPARPEEKRVRPAETEPARPERRARRTSALSRFRRGGRGGGGRAPAGAGKPADTGRPPPEDADAGGPATTGDAGADMVEYMVRNYKGVGRKTAETLVEELGADVFDVIDANPDRIRAILPGRRAEAVISARTAEARKA